MSTHHQHGLIRLIDQAASLSGQHLSRARLALLSRELDALTADRAPGAALDAAWQAAGLEGSTQALAVPTPADLPFAVLCPHAGWLLVQAGAGAAWYGEDGNGTRRAIEPAGLVCLALPRRPAAEPATARPSALRLVSAALWRKRSVFGDAVLATSLITLLTMVTSLFSMQVYDRVIPNQSLSTLWVLGVGVVLSIMVEFVLKQVRNNTVDRACNEVDHDMAQWFFGRMLGVRMEARPSAVGTLAAQVKGFEMVRGVLTSTSLFVLTDVPFALVFLVVIAFIGGALVAIPLAALPLALLCGLMFQRAIERHTRRNLDAGNRKAGLLVEAVDGVETLKGSGAEWLMQARWKALVGEAGMAEQQVRHYSALSQNITSAFQQLSNVAMIALGAWMVSDNQMSMGALLACTMISNRALAPIIQLTGVMVQWAHARAALDGLEQIVRLPNEADQAASALNPRALEPGLRLERIRFTHGGAQRTALELEALHIRPGERVGLIGAIGSGKSTLLKLASGLYRPAEGKVLLGEVDMALLATPLLRETIGYLPQDTRLFSGTLRENLVLGLADPGEEAILAAARRTGLIELILGQPQGLALTLTEGGRGVSGGQRQLIAITRLLLARPRVWLLDEPTGAMDARSEARIVALLGELAAEGITLVATTHKNALLPLLDRLVVLQGGRLLLDGPREAVLAKLSGKPQVVTPANAGALA